MSVFFNPLLGESLSLNEFQFCLTSSLYKWNISYTWMLLALFNASYLSSNSFVWYWKSRQILKLLLGLCCFLIVNPERLQDLLASYLLEISCSNISRSPGKSIFLAQGDQTIEVEGDEHNRVTLSE